MTGRQKQYDQVADMNKTASHLLSETEVAEIYGFRLPTLRNWRATRVGPRFLKINGKMIRYRISDIEDYLASCLEKTVDQRD